jgi:hypothetical protein
MARSQWHAPSGSRRPADVVSGLDGAFGIRFGRADARIADLYPHRCQDLQRGPQA